MGMDVKTARRSRVHSPGGSGLNCVRFDLSRSFLSFPIGQISTNPLNFGASFDRQILAWYNMNVKVVLILACTVLVVFGSCSKTCYCNQATLHLDYVAFDSAETDSLIVYTYPKGSGFANALDTLLLTEQNADFQFIQDTLSIGFRGDSAALKSVYDYVFFLPSINRGDSLFGVFETRDTEEGGHDLECNCTNRVLSYRLNRDTLTFTQPADPHIYIYK